MRNVLLIAALGLLVAGCSAASIQETWDRQSTNQKIGLGAGLIVGTAVMGPPGILIGPIAGLGAATAIDCVKAPDCP